MNKDQAKQINDRIRLACKEHFLKHANVEEFDWENDPKFEHGYRFERHSIEIYISNKNVEDGWARIGDVKLGFGCLEEMEVKTYVNVNVMNFIHFLEKWIDTAPSEEEYKEASEKILLQDFSQDKFNSMQIELDLAEKSNKALRESNAKLYEENRVLANSPEIKLIKEQNKDLLDRIFNKI